MALVRLIYTSTAREQCSDSDIKSILESSIKLNALNGVSGILYYSSSYFMQYLEGRRSDVDDTLARITNDNRHRSLRVVDRFSISEREFAEWSMAYVPNSEILTPLNLEFMNGTQFNPQAISASDALRLTRKLRALLPVAHYRDQSAGCDGNPDDTDEPRVR